MIEVKTYRPEEIPDERLAYAVIAARYQNKWIFCRHKKRTTWEIPGGHRESGEHILHAAERELYEETGALSFRLRQLCVYSAASEKGIGYGMLYLADVYALGDLPAEFEIGEVEQFETIPKELTYPEIQGTLFRSVQNWLNLQSNPDELWDIYDENRKLTGTTHRRADPLCPGEFHLSVHVWIRNREGQYLLTKRAPNKGYPNMWECTGGSALAGDDSLAAALREVREETGLVLSPTQGYCVMSLTRKNDFCDIWLFQADFDLRTLTLLPGETCDAMFASKEQILQMHRDGTLVSFSYLETFFDLAGEV